MMHFALRIMVGSHVEEHFIILPQIESKVGLANVEVSALHAPPGTTRHHQAPPGTASRTAAGTAR